MSPPFERFLAAARAARSDLFNRFAPITAARAPGWVDLIGGAAGGGCLALGRPLALSSFAAIQPDSSPHLLVQIEGSPPQSLALSELRDGDGWPYPYAETAARLAELAPALRYAAAIWLTLLREEFMRPPGGARILLQIAEGPGGDLSALTAIAQALVTAFQVRLPARELALACRIAAIKLLQQPLGTLGPLTAAKAPAGELLMLHQQPAWEWGNLHLPPDTAIWAIQVGDGPQADPAASHTAAAMAYQMLADAADLSESEAAARWGGYLARIGSATFQRRYQALLPEHISGSAFLGHYPQTRGLDIQPGSSYPLRAAAALPIEEHLRARTIAALIRAAASHTQRDDDLRLIGEILFQSHWAQRAAGIGDPHADALVEQVEAAARSSELYGARMPAAESGATLVILGKPEAEPAIQQISRRYAVTSGLPVVLYGGSAPGCNPAGARTLDS